MGAKVRMGFRIIDWFNVNDFSEWLHEDIEVVLDQEHKQFLNQLEKWRSLSKRRYLIWRSIIRRSLIREVGTG